MDLNNHIGKLGEPHDIRRHSGELGRAFSRDSANKIDFRKSATFSEIPGAHTGTHLQVKPLATPAGKNGKQFALWEKGDGFGFGDFLDIINPLQHVPIISTVYRNYTNDQIGAAPRVIGGALWGRIGGFVTGLANALVEWWSGKDIGDHIYAALFGTPNKGLNASAVAQSNSPPSAPIKGTANPAGEKSSGAEIVTPGQKPPTASDAAHPNALRSALFPLSSVAHSSYQRSRKWGEPDESLGVWFPA